MALATTLEDLQTETQNDNNTRTALCVFMIILHFWVSF